MKYIIQFRDTKLPISEDEVEKVTRAMSEKKIVMLNCGIINGAFISAILKDINGERGYNLGYDSSKELTRKDYLCDFNEEIKKLGKSDQLMIE